MRLIGIRKQRNRAARALLDCRDCLRAVRDIAQHGSREHVNAVGRQIARTLYAFFYRQNRLGYTFVGKRPIDDICRQTRHDFAVHDGFELAFLGTQHVVDAQAHRVRPNIDDRILHRAIPPFRIS